MKKPRKSEPDIDNYVKEVALRLALHCVRNTVIEDYHSQGKLSDQEMMKFNKAVVNKLYTYLQVLLNPKYREENELMFKNLKNMPPFFYRPSGWDEPVFDKEILNALRKVKKYQAEV